MAFTYNGNTPKEITYNGATVSTVICNGVVVWQRNKDFVASWSYSDSSLNAYSSPDSSTKITTLSASNGANGRFLLISETEQNGRVPIFHYDNNTKKWSFYWISNTRINKTTTFTISTDSMIVASRATSTHYYTIYSDVELQNELITMQPNIPFFEVYNSEPIINSHGASVYQVRTYNVRNGVETEYNGYLEVYYLTGVLDLSEFDIIDLV